MSPRRIPPSLSLMGTSFSQSRSSSQSIWTTEPSCFENLGRRLKRTPPIGEGPVGFDKIDFNSTDSLRHCKRMRIKQKILHPQNNLYLVCCSALPGGDKAAQKVGVGPYRDGGTRGGVGLTCGEDLEKYPGIRSPWFSPFSSTGPHMSFLRSKAPNRKDRSSS